MKYIKLFESFDLKVEFKSGYEIIDGDEYEYFVYNSHYYDYQTDFTEVELDKIKSLFDTSNNVRIEHPIGTVFDKKQPNYIMLEPSDSSALIITKFKDEWFFIEVEGVMNLYYKCDQLDGLANALEDIKNKFK